MSEQSEGKYLTFPIDLIAGGFYDPKEMINDIFSYGGYYIADKYKYRGSKADKMMAAGKFLGITYNAFTARYDDGSKLFNSIPPKPPMTSINKNMLFDFRDNSKTEFEIICFFAFIAIRSILQTKSYVKMDNQYLFTRMAGWRSVNNEIPFPTHLLKYLNRYQIDKIFNELQTWGLKYYARHTRGYYVSFDLTFEELVTKAEEKRKSYLAKKKKQEQSEIINRVLAKIHTTP